jgi:hypothetical protein
MKKWRTFMLAAAAATALAFPAGATRHAAGSVVLRHGGPALQLTQGLFLNWSGYASYGDSTEFRNVQGSWTQPTATCDKKQSTYASFWVGIDGYNSNTVEQIGTDADCSRGVAVHYAWYEMYPAAPVNLPSGDYPVNAGDVITAGVDQSSGKLTISNSTQEWTYETTQSFAGFDLSSAEWVAEAPSLCSRGGCHIAPLTNFGTVAFTGASANGHAIDYSGWSSDAMTMVTNNGRTIKAAPSSLTGGNSFSVTWSHR